ncbi:hypothetical protein DFAR_2910012 [Desulfarculales bacterium]
MPGLKERFRQAASGVKTLSKKPDTRTLLKLYALYKQGDQGDINIKRPRDFDPEGKAKYNI